MSNTTAKESTSTNIRRWPRVCFWLLSAIWAFLLCWVLVFLSRVALSGVYFGTACRPDGSFSPFGDDYRWWSKDGFFQITIGFGTLSFTEAKVVDAAWELIVGRSGQAVMVYVSWRVFADYAAASMITYPVTYTSFWVIFLHREPSLVSLFQLIRDLLPGGPGIFHSRVATAFVLATMLYIISFPTLAGSMSGYTPANEAFILARDLSLIPFSDFNKTAFHIRGGGRAGFESNSYPVPYNVTVDINTYGLHNSSDSDSKWGNQTIPYILNITAFYFRPLSDRTVKYGYNWVDPITGGIPTQDPQKRTYSAKGELYSLNYIKANGTCQPITEDRCNADSSIDGDSCSIQKYMWGFSYMQLFINTILLILWTVGTFIMWVKAHFRLPLHDYPEVPRGWRAIRELSHAMDAEFDRNDIDADAVTDDELKKAIRKHIKGGSVVFRGTLERSKHWSCTYMGDAQGGWLRRGLALYILAAIVAFSIGLYTMTTRGTRAVVQGKVWEMPKHKLLEV
ncbi:hypothetical protein B0T25DRAFT_503842 [Lasiosphaeria hispida]|uniref:Uncharacterized protein n=1 Tax=Lasiosphaeria hispida TaxID=260671 RepID=A0AAJ0HE40_9PEZI|nr:hypothetical protein B0T25DRAFT_503842 [Lasiosphaeria hispida]